MVLNLDLLDSTRTDILISVINSIEYFPDAYRRVKPHMVEPRCQGPGNPSITKRLACDCLMYGIMDLGPPS